jgi:hypothetical protein
VAGGSVLALSIIAVSGTALYGGIDAYRTCSAWRTSASADRHTLSSTDLLP